MAYTTQADVEALNGTSYDTTTIPTAAQVDYFIDWASAEIDAYYSSLDVATPVSGNDYLKMMATLKAAALAEAAYKRNNIGTTDADWRLTEYNRMMQELKNNPELGGVTIGAAGKKSRSDYTTGWSGLSEYEYKKEVRGW